MQRNFRAAVCHRCARPSKTIVKHCPNRIANKRPVHMMKSAGINPCIFPWVPSPSTSLSTGGVGKGIGCTPRRPLLSLKALSGSDWSLDWHCTAALLLFSLPRSLVVGHYRALIKSDTTHYLSRALHRLT